ncbi:MAG: lipocalin-like domain-containing protein [Prevotella sp.]|nr:lipocalin-like domain-containing protein [Prevotella sp.]
MARFSKYFFLLTSSIILFTSCQEGGDAGDLLGQWRLTTKEDMYVSFSGSITQFRKNNGQAVFAKFQHVGDSLFMQCSSIKQQKSDTTMIENEFGMKPFTNIRVRIDALDSDHLTLSKDNQHWVLEKY